LRVDDLKGDRIQGKTFESSATGDIYVDQYDRFDEDGNFIGIDHPDGPNLGVPC
jgi:hypothetical protein